MARFTIENVTVEGDNITMQDAFAAWLQVALYEIEDIDEGLPDEATVKAHLMERFRQIRTKLLAEYDWMFLEDSPASAQQKQRVAAWRQQMRDLPQQYSDVRDMVVPELPA